MGHTPNLIHRLLSLRRQLQAYADAWRSLPAELASLADTRPNSVDMTVERASSQSFD